MTLLSLLYNSRMKEGSKVHLYLGVVNMGVWLKNTMVKYSEQEQVYRRWTKMQEASLFPFLKGRHFFLCLCIITKKQRWWVK